MGLCKKDNIEGVKWCLKHTPSDKEMKKMIEKKNNKYLRFPLLSAVHKNKSNEITCDATGCNILKLPTYLLDSGRLQVSKEVVDIFKDTKKLDHCENAEGMNALMMAALQVDASDSLKFLVDYYREADLIDKKSMIGKTALHYAEERGYERWNILWLTMSIIIFVV